MKICSLIFLAATALATDGFTAYDNPCYKLSLEAQTTVTNGEVCISASLIDRCYLCLAAGGSVSQTAGTCPRQLSCSTPSSQATTAPPATPAGGNTGGGTDPVSGTTAPAPPSGGNTGTYNPCLNADGSNNCPLVRCAEPAACPAGTYKPKNQCLFTGWLDTTQQPSCSWKYSPCSFLCFCDGTQVPIPQDIAGSPDRVKAFCSGQTQPTPPPPQCLVACQEIDTATLECPAKPTNCYYTGSTDPCGCKLPCTGLRCEICDKYRDQATFAADVNAGSLLASTYDRCMTAAKQCGGARLGVVVDAAGQATFTCSKENTNCPDACPPIAGCPAPPQGCTYTGISSRVDECGCPSGGCGELVCCNKDGLTAAGTGAFGGEFTATGQIACPVPDCPPPPFGCRYQNPIFGPCGCQRSCGELVCDACVQQDGNVFAGFDRPCFVPQCPQAPENCRWSGSVSTGVCGCPSGDCGDLICRNSCDQPPPLPAGGGGTVLVEGGATAGGGTTTGGNTGVAGTGTADANVQGFLSCGGFAGGVCPDGQKCVDDPRDDCDPAKGGADCLGICQVQQCSPDQKCTDPALVCNPATGRCEKPAAGEACPQYDALFCPRLPQNCQYRPAPLTFSDDCGCPSPCGIPVCQCGGIAGWQCPAGQTCVDDPKDDCDPAKGGADCMGICRRPVTEQCVCPEYYAPVCSADGKRFSNPCFAQCAGVTEYRRCDATGEQPVPPAGRQPGDKCEAKECLGQPRLLCPVRQCPDGVTVYGCTNECRVNRDGTCSYSIVSPDVCTGGNCECKPSQRESGPVCGADGRTYASACAAICAGATQFRAGRCCEFFAAPGTCTNDRVFATVADGECSVGGCVPPPDKCADCADPACCVSEVPAVDTVRDAVNTDRNGKRQDDNQQRPVARPCVKKCAPRASLFDRDRVAQCVVTVSCPPPTDGEQVGRVYYYAVDGGCPEPADVQATYEAKCKAAMAADTAITKCEVTVRQSTDNPCLSVAVVTVNGGGSGADDNFATDPNFIRGDSLDMLDENGEPVTPSEPGDKEPGNQSGDESGLDSGTTAVLIVFGVLLALAVCSFVGYMAYRGGKESAQDRQAMATSMRGTEAEFQRERVSSRRGMAAGGSRTTSSGRVRRTSQLRD